MYELYHHGILGQKWGVRRYQNYDGSLKAAGKERYGSGEVKVKRSKRKYELRDLKYDPKSGLPLKNREMTPEEDCARVNPNYKKFSSFAAGTNCSLCTTAYDLRRRGFEVEASQRINGLNTLQLCKLYKNAKANLVPFNFGEENISDAVEKELLKQGDGARGNLLVLWSGGGGHSMAYENANGKCRILDTQINKIYDFHSSDSKDNPEYMLSRTIMSRIQYIRTDNLEPNYEEIERRGIVL